MVLERDATKRDRLTVFADADARHLQAAAEIFRPHTRIFSPVPLFSGGEISEDQRSGKGSPHHPCGDNTYFDLANWRTQKHISPGCGGTQAVGGIFVQDLELLVIQLEQSTILERKRKGVDNIFCRVWLTALGRLPRTLKHLYAKGDVDRYIVTTGVAGGERASKRFRGIGTIGQAEFVRLRAEDFGRVATRQPVSPRGVEIVFVDRYWKKVSIDLWTRLGRIGCVDNATLAAAQPQARGYQTDSKQRQKLAP